MPAPDPDDASYEIKEARRIMSDVASEDAQLQIVLRSYLAMAVRCRPLVQQLVRMMSERGVEDPASVLHWFMADQCVPRSLIEHTEVLVAMRDTNNEVHTFPIPIDVDSLAL